MNEDQARANLRSGVKLRKAAAAWRQVEGETILLNLESSMYLGVNSSGTTLWPMMAEGTSRTAMIESLCSTYGIDERRAAMDVDQFIDACRVRNLLEP